MRRPLKIPTILGIILAIILTVGISVIFEQVSRRRSKAAPNLVPQQVMATNISDTTFTFSWVTSAPTTGAILIEGTGKKQTVFDERGEGKYLTHSATFRMAQPSSVYTVKIISGGKIFLTEDKPYSIKTAPTITGSGSGLEPAFGSVFTDTAEAADGALVYLTASGGQTLSTLVKPSGNWIIPLNGLRTNILDQYFSATTERIEENIVVRLGEKEASAVTDSLNDSPVPEIILGKNYDFRRQQARIPGQVAGVSQSQSFTLTKPADGTVLTTAIPLVQGTGIPGTTVLLTLGITNPVAGTTLVGSDGIWQFTPTQTLPPGKQAVTATGQTSNGQTAAVTHIFEILKSGTQVLGEATPSATPRLTPTLTPTLMASPSPTSTLAGQPVPTSGSVLPTIMLLIISLGLITGSLWLRY